MKIINKDEYENYVLDIVKPYKFWEHTKGEGVKIVLIDSGIDINNDEIKHAVKSKINLIDHTTDVTDNYGHGTFMSGLLVSETFGLAKNSKLYTVKVLDDFGQGTWSSVMDGITYAINIKADILCISIGTMDSIPQIFSEKLTYARQKGIMIFASSGNNGINSISPIAKNPNVLAVGGCDKYGNRANFSNYGEGLGCVAPSVDIPSIYLNNQYAIDSGTSMATGIVASGFALILSYVRKQGLDMKPFELFDLLDCLDNDVYKKDDLGHGVFDLEKIYNCLLTKA